VSFCGFVVLCRYDFEADQQTQPRYTEHLENFFRHDDDWMTRIQQAK
jgi:hypothetical protein